jgi:hypothetical protein
MTDNSGLISDALLRTDPGLYESVDGGNSWKDGLTTRGARVDKYRQYEKGNHDANMTDQMRHMLRLKTDTANLNEFNLNYCKVVIDEMASRLFVNEVTTDTEAGNEWLEEITSDNDFARLQSEAFRSAIRDAESYVMVDPVTVRWVAEPSYDGFSGIVAIYDMSGVPIWACKLWSEADNDDLAEDSASDNVMMKIVVYQLDKVSFWKGTAGSQTVDPAEPPPGTKGADGNTVPWPLDVLPLVPFVNQRDSYTPYGESEIRPVIPPQNALNRTLHSMIMASEFSAFKLYWSKGMEIDKDSIVPGSVVNLVVKNASGVVETDLTEGQVSFLDAIAVGEFNESNMENYTVQIDRLVREISQVSQTPIYGVTAQGNLSGEALKQLEVGLIGKIIRFQRENTDAVRSMVNLAAKIQNEFAVGNGSAPAFDNVAVIWQSPELIDIPGQLAAIGKLFLDFGTSLFPVEWYREQVGNLLSMSQAKIREEGDKADVSQRFELENFLGSGGELGAEQVLFGDQEQTSQNLESAAGLNGAQITASISVMKSISDGTITPEVAEELLVAVGINQEKASRMVASQQTVQITKEATV